MSDYFISSCSEHHHSSVFARLIAYCCCCHFWIALYFVACCSCLSCTCYSFCYVDTPQLDDVLHFTQFVFCLSFITHVVHFYSFSRSNVCPCLHLSIIYLYQSSFLILLWYFTRHQCQMPQKLFCLRTFIHFAHSLKKLFAFASLTLDIVSSLISLTLQSKLDWH